MTTSVVDLEVPETLQALVASRLDGLSGSERRRVTSLLPPAGAAASLALGTEAQRYFEHAMELSNDDLERAGLLEQAGQALWQSGTPPAPSSVCARQPSSEGDAGDSFYAITHGSMLVTIGGREIRRMDSGQGFGEIALLYSVTRTATVAATTETTLLRVGREAFLTAMRAHPSVSAAAEMLARKRAGESG
jgi:CRP-like cAMP-binding protein